ncbi:hypothetical protein HYZ41_01935 [archaeon]|nr:hypothetical protein [archaeon]
MKGQWFLISAVVATTIFLVISGLFKSYFVADSSLIARSNEGFYFHNIEQQINNSIYQPDCTMMERSLREFRSFVQKEIEKFGYVAFVNYSYVCEPGIRTVTPGIFVSSERMILCKNVDINNILSPGAVDLLCR